MTGDKLNFYITEGDEFDWDSFTKDYIECRLTKQEMMEKYDLSNGRYHNKTRRVVKDTGFRRPNGYHHVGNNMRNIKKDNKNWVINKTINNKRIYFGTYPTLEVASMVRDKLEEENWTDEAYYKYKEMYGVNRKDQNGNWYAPKKSKALELYPKVIDDYDHSLNLMKSCRKYGLDRYQYNIIREKLRSEEA